MAMEYLNKYKEKIMKNFVLSIFTSAFIFGCGGEEVKTVEWYQDHEQERLTLLQQCDNDTDKAMTSNCRNAIKAQAKVSTNNLLYGDGIQLND